MSRSQKRLQHKGYVDGRAGRARTSCELVYLAGYAKGSQARAAHEGNEQKRDSLEGASSTGRAARARETIALRV